MVIFDLLRLSDDGKKLYISAHVNKASYFDNMYISRVTVMTQDQVSTSDPLIPVEDKYIWQQEYTAEENIREINLVIGAEDCIRRWESNVQKMNFSQADMLKTLFFVYIEEGGTLGECTPCRLDEKTTLGVTFDENLLYQRVMNYTRELADDCSVPQGFTDFILQWNAFKSAIETEHYLPAIDYWKRLFGEGTALSTAYSTRGCGCGRSQGV